MSLCVNWAGLSIHWPGSGFRFHLKFLLNFSLEAESLGKGQGNFFNLLWLANENKYYLSMKVIQVLVFVEFSDTLPSLSFWLKVSAILFKISFLSFIDTLEFHCILENDLYPWKVTYLLKRWATIWIFFHHRQIAFTKQLVIHTNREHIKLIGPLPS